MKLVHEVKMEVDSRDEARRTEKNDVYTVSECVGFNVHLTHNRSFQRQVFPGNQLRWY